MALTTPAYNEVTAVTGSWTRADTNLASRGWLEVHNDDDTIEILVRFAAADPGAGVTTGLRTPPLGTQGPINFGPGIGAWVRAVSSSQGAANTKALEGA